MRDRVIDSFRKCKDKNPFMGNIPCLAQAIKGEKLNEAQIKRYLYMLCKEDYDFSKSDKKTLT